MKTLKYLLVSTVDQFVIRFWKCTCDTREPQRELLFELNFNSSIHPWFVNILNLFQSCTFNSILSPCFKIKSKVSFLQVFFFCNVNFHLPNRPVERNYVSKCKFCYLESKGLSTVKSSSVFFVYPETWRWVNTQKHFAL